jgi:hypothetical protein
VALPVGACRNWAARAARLRLSSATLQSPLRVLLALGATRFQRAVVSAAQAREQRNGDDSAGRWQAARQPLAGMRTVGGVDVPRRNTGSAPNTA